MKVTVNGKPIDITAETITATRQWFADLDRACIREASAFVTTDGLLGFRVNDLARYVEHHEKCAAAALAGESDHTLAFMQRAVFIQTGESVPILAP